MLQWEIRCNFVLGLKKKSTCKLSSKELIKTWVIKPWQEKIELEVINTSIKKEVAYLLKTNYQMF